MRRSLLELHKALKEHQGAVDQYFAAHDKVHETLERCTKSIASAAGGDHAISGHLGSIAKAVAAHKSMHEITKAAHGILHKAVSNAITSISDRSGITVGAGNANEALANGGRATGRDISGAGDIEHGVLPDQAAHGSQKGYTSRDLQKCVDHLQNTMPVFGRRGPGLRVFKNADSPHWRGRKTYEVPDLSVVLSNKY